MLPMKVGLKKDFFFVSPRVKIAPTMSQPEDQCALGPGGKLLEADQIEWYEDRDDELPMSNLNPAQPPAINKDGES